MNGVSIHRLIDAIRAGDIATVDTTLAAHPELARMCVADTDEHQALHHAVLTRQPEMVRLLMRHGADPHAGIWPHRDATTPLTIAGDRGYDDIVALIREEELTRTPVAHAVDDRERASVMDAFRRGDQDALIAFFDTHPALVNAVNPHDGTTPLMMASLYLLERVVAWLLEHGADPRARTNAGGTALGAVGGHVNTDSAGWTVRVGAIANLLLHHGAEMTPGWAVHSGNLEQLRELHDGFATASERDGSMHHLLSMAVGARRADVVQFLLDLGYDPDERRPINGPESGVDTWGEPLRSAVILGDIAIARMLLERGATPHTNVYAASSAMYEAYIRQHASIIELLEERGGTLQPGDMAYLGLTDRAKRALDDAAQRRDRHTRHPSSAEAVLQGAADTGNVDLVRIALAHIEWPSGDRRWHWMLMRPLGRHTPDDRGRFVSCFGLLLDRSGAHVTGPFGRTILHDVAAAWPRGGAMGPDDRIAFGTELLDRSAPLDPRDDLLRSTPLGWACRWGRVELVRLLLARGADPIERDAESWATPRAWALKSGNQEIVALISATAP